MDFAYYDGNYTRFSDMRFPINDSAIFFGDGVYDAMVGRREKIYMFDEHIQRFESNLDALSLAVNTGGMSLREILSSLLLRIEKGYAFLYLQATRKRDERRHSAHGQKEAHLFAYAKAFSLPDEGRRLSLVTVEDRRYDYCHIKTLNLLPNVLASTYADSLGADEAVFIRDGVVRECSHSNISIMQDGMLLTHPLDTHILPGTMRKKLIDTARREGYEVRERAFTLEELYRADGVFITSTTKRCVLCDRVNQRMLPHPSDLAIRLFELVNSEFYNEMEKI